MPHGWHEGWMEAIMNNRYSECRSKLPQSYSEHIERNNGFEGDLGEEFGYIVIWNKEAIQNRWDDYEMSQYLSDFWFPFGSDGGGEMLCFDLRRSDDAVYCIPYVGMSDDEAIHKYVSFATISQKILENT
jgi:hypothetical protein